MSPRGMLMASVAAIILAAAAGLYWKGRHEGAAGERPKTEAALAQARIAGLETEGARDSAQRVEAMVRQREAAADVVAQLKAKALTSEDANAPLDPDRALRIRAADLQLCQSRRLDGCPAPGDAG